MAGRCTELGLIELAKDYVQEGDIKKAEVTRRIQFKSSAASVSCAILAWMDFFYGVSVLCDNTNATGHPLHGPNGSADAQEFGPQRSWNHEPVFVVQTYVARCCSTHTGK